VTVTAYDSAGVVRGTATSGSTGAYTLNATGTGPYRIQFTNLPAGFVDSQRGTGSGTTVQFVPNGNSTASLGLSRASDYNLDNPLLVSNEYIFGDQLNGPYASSPVLLSYAYSAGTQYNGSGDYSQPNTHSIAVPANKLGSVFGLGTSVST